MKKFIVILTVLCLTFSLFANGGKEAATTKELSRVQQVIKDAEAMSLEELAKKAIEESNGATFYGVGNSSRGKTALPLFIAYLQSIDSSYTLNYEWQQPKENSIFEMLSSDSQKATGTFAMTLIQDGNQIESKMVKTGILDNFIPLECAKANGTTADALSTALFVMGLDGAEELYRSGSLDFEMILYDGSKVYVSEGVADSFSTDMNKEIITR